GMAYGGYGSGSYYGYYGGMPYSDGYYYGGSPYILPMPAAEDQRYYQEGPAGRGKLPRPPEDRGTPRGDPSGQKNTPPGQGSLTPAPATIVVSLPAEARLTVSGESTRSTSDLRTFVSPVLQPGKTYRYDLEAEITQNGRTQKTSQQVIVRAGQETRVTLTFP